MALKTKQFRKQIIFSGELRLGGVKHLHQHGNHHSVKAVQQKRTLISTTRTFPHPANYTAEIKSSTANSYTNVLLR